MSGTPLSGSTPHVQQGLACCPAGSHGPAPASNYRPQGCVEDLDGVPCYVVGDGQGAILVGHDAFGVDSGRTKQICDELASSLGVLVVVPAFFTAGAAAGLCAEYSEAISPTVPRPAWWRLLGNYMGCAWNMPAFLRDLRAHRWEAVGPQVQDKVLPAMRRRGVAKVALLGFCWGGWLVLHASASNDFCCGATAHPSQAEVCSLLGEDIHGLCEQVQCPQMILSASNDHAKTKEGGIAHNAYSAKSFGQDCVFETFLDMKHGWVNRACLDDENVARDFQNALEMLKAFYRKHLL